MAYFSVDDFFAMSATILVDPLVPGSRNAIWFVWGGLFVAFYLIRRFLIQYLGDVVAYVTSYRLDRFFKIRRWIKFLIHDVLYAIYAQNDDQGNPVYHHVRLIGHSLGSVIAYDALNALLNEDAFKGNAMKVVECTRVLATFASPLDKIAYVFSLAGQHTSDNREALAAAVQPLIVNYAKYRQFHSVNVYSERDIIGSSIDFFDMHFPAGANYRQELDNNHIPKALRAKFQEEGFGLLDSTTTVYAITSNGVKHWEIHDKEAGSFTIRDEAGELSVYPERQIKNVIDPDALIPLVAHTELWKTGKVFDEFYEAFC